MSTPHPTPTEPRHPRNVLAIVGIAAAIGGVLTLFAPVSPEIMLLVIVFGGGVSAVACMKSVTGAASRRLPLAGVAVTILALTYLTLFTFPVDDPHRVTDPSPHEITYEVHGNASVAIAYGVAESGMALDTVHSPRLTWTHSVHDTINEGLTATLTVRLDGPGHALCVIKIDGVLVASEPAASRGDIAACAAIIDDPRAR